ncbi:MAG TPA: histidine kinase [Puia sp.]|nr:histidine kinase [Puia sp.]
MKKYFFILIFLIVIKNALAQIKWSNDSVSINNISWNNYSTTYTGAAGTNGDSIPIIVTAIPHNGMGSNFDNMNTPLDLSFNGSLFRFRSALSYNSLHLYTYDSSEIYFITPGIFQSNASKYEFRVTLNAQKIITPWSTIQKFTNLQLNTFRKGFGFIGGYKTTWGNVIIVELKQKGSDKILSSAVVYWKEIKPTISSIYTTADLNTFFKFLQRPWDKTIIKKEVPKTLALNAGENNIIFSISDDIFAKEALEYSLIKNEKNFVYWKANDFDNNFIWLQNLSYGNYVLQMRFAKQRHNITTYKFEIKPHWYQTTAFKLTIITLIFASLASIFLLFRLRNQKKKFAIEQQQREKKETELKAIRAQLNPHFIFNSLSSIQGLINKNEIENANRYLSDFANLLRTTLTSNDKGNITLDSEIKTLNDYLNLEQLRFHFQYKLNIDPSINSSTIETPSLLLQPLVENAVKHGVSVLQEKGVIQISFMRKEKDLIVEVHDNGNGFKNFETNNGYGLKLTKDRIALLNQISKDQNIFLEIKSGKGTTVILTFQNWL